MNNDFGYMMPNYYTDPYYRPQREQLPHMEIIVVHGYNGADAFQMGPNSSVLLLDDTAPVVWLKKTDGAGYPTLIDYDITKREHPAEPDYNALMDRIAKIEEVLHAKSNTPESGKGTGTNANANGAGSGE